MQLTQEQQVIIAADHDLVVNAVAGSGKTTTLIEYAKARPKNSRILYLIFNKSVQLEAEKKFEAAGLNNVTVRTAHSLAFQHVVKGSRYKVNNKGYSSHEMVKLLDLAVEGNERHAEHILANHIKRLVACFCNSDKKRVKEIDYLATINEKKARTFASNLYALIQQKARVFLDLMQKGEIEMTHEFYLKKFQLSQPDLGYDYILFDEGQDASPVMLDVFLKQKAIKVIVGDQHQQIYAWRFAVNALSCVNFKTLQLSTSFRFPKAIAELAIRTLDWKNHLKDHEKVVINGMGTAGEPQTKAILARTNLGLLQQAIDYIHDNPNNDQLYFEGNINSYTYAEDGASLYDVLNLAQGRKARIKNELIRKMEDLEDLEDYVDSTGDEEIRLLLKIVQEHGDEIPGLLNEIKARHAVKQDRTAADMIFSTVHKSKGMEYDEVYLASDFINEETILKKRDEIEAGELDPARLIEEINLLYVAMTRAKCKLYIDHELLPVGIQPSEYIQTRKPHEKITELLYPEAEEVEMLESKSYDVKEIRKTHGKAYAKWTPERDDLLTELFCNGYTTSEMAEQLGRSKGAIRSRIKKLELEEKYGF